jgi:SAM-dependent methyltransferase
MMLGTREEFTYGLCTSCGALQLLDVPADLGRYYPPEYYAFAPRQRSGAVMAVRRLRNRLAIAPRGPVARAVAALAPHAATPWFAHVSLRRTARILDVGCGAGELLVDLSEAGFTSLTGVDAFVSRSYEPAPGLRIVRGTIDDVTGEFDLVMFHHSLEHMSGQREALGAATRLLAPDGWCLVRVPLVSSQAWENYREHWVQLDAPRHIVLHSIDSLRQLAAAVGLVLDNVEHDSTEFQFIGSELYRRDRTLAELGTAFSRRVRRRYRRLAAQLNAEQRGDQAAFYFRKPA